jgi:uncharacterized protein (TIGR02246 family)
VAQALLFTLRVGRACAPTIVTEPPANIAIGRTSNQKGETEMPVSNPVAAKTNDEAQIRQLNEDWRNAVANRDLDKLVQHYSPDVLYFNVVPPYQHRGVVAYRRTWEQMSPHLPPHISVEQRDLDITASGDLAVSHCLTRIVNAQTNENAAVGWVRVTVCYQRQQGAWRAIHEHVSVPIDPMTGKVVPVREP